MFNDVHLFLQGRVTKITPVSADCWMTVDDYEAVERRVISINYLEASEAKWKWPGMWRPAVKEFVDKVIPNQLELANMDEHRLNPLGQKKIAMFRSKYHFGKKCV